MCLATALSVVYRSPLCSNPSPSGRTVTRTVSPLYWRTITEPTLGSLGSLAVCDLVTVDRTPLCGGQIRAFGAMTRTSESLASSAARTLARSLNPPIASAWIRHAILRIRYCRCRVRTGWPWRSWYRAASSPVVMCWSSASWLSIVVSIVSVNRHLPCMDSVLRVARRVVRRHTEVCMGWIFKCLW